MIVPQRDALESDKVRPLTTVDDWLWASGGVTVDTWNELRPNDPVHRRGHYGVYSSDSLKELIEHFFNGFLELVAFEDPDKKVSNGFCLVYQVHKPAPVPVGDIEPETFVTVRGQGELTENVGRDLPEGHAQGGYVTDDIGLFVAPNVSAVTKAQAQALMQQADAIVQAVTEGVSDEQAKENLNALLGMAADSLKANTGELYIGDDVPESLVHPPKKTRAKKK